MLSREIRPYQLSFKHISLHLYAPITMLFRNSISSTRRFFRRTLGTLKSLFSGGQYQKLPKSPLEKPLLSGCAKIAGVTDCDTQEMSTEVMENVNDQRSLLTETIESKTAKEDNVKSGCQSSSTTKTNSENKRIKRKVNHSETSIMKRKEDRSSENNCKELKKSNDNLVEQKLKELEMLDLSNVDHVLDIEEVLHYYSRLTCPAYVEIVDKFFAEILAEFFASSTPVQSINSKPRHSQEMI